MPTATPFGGGKGNGFPFCLERVNLDENYIYTDASGTEHSYPIVDYHLMTLAQAVRVFWNLYSISVDGFADGPDTNGPLDETFTGIGTVSGVEQKPRKRLCDPRAFFEDGANDFSGDNLTINLEFRIFNFIWAVYFASASDTVPLGYGTTPQVAGNYVNDGKVAISSRATSFDDLDGKRLSKNYFTAVLDSGGTFGNISDWTYSKPTINGINWLKEEAIFEEGDPNGYSVSLTEPVFDFYTYP